jgi:hypothetical protein
MNDIRVINAKQDEAAINEAAKATLRGDPHHAQQVLEVLIEDGVEMVMERYEAALRRLRGIK